MFKLCGGGRSLHIQHWHSPARGELEALYRFSGNGPAPGGEGTRRGEADAIAKTAIASRQKVKLSVPRFCSAKTLGGLSTKANRRRKQLSFFEATYRRRRRRGFWRKLRNPHTLRVIIRMAWFIYRILRWLIEVFAPFG